VLPFSDPAALEFLVTGPLTTADVNAIVHSGLNDSDVCERVLVRSDRVANAIELEIGEGLLALSEGRRLISLGYSSVGDYAREVLGDEHRTAENRVHLARELRKRPLLRAAVFSGAVGRRAAEIVLPVATGDDQQAWVALARTCTTRALEELVRKERHASGKAETLEESWSRMRLRLPEDYRVAVDWATDLAGRLLPGATLARKLEAIGQEYLASNAGRVKEEDEPTVPTGCFRPAPDLSLDRDAMRDAEEAKLEEETEGWSYLEAVPDVPAMADSFAGLDSAHDIDAKLRELARLRTRWDVVTGKAARMVRRSGLWRLLGFNDFRHYCEVRLRMSPRAVEQRAAVEDRLAALKVLRRARDEGLSYEKVRLLSRLRNPSRIAAWIPWAWGMTCIQLDRVLGAEREGQMRAAHLLALCLPIGAALVLANAFEAVRARLGAPAFDSTCLFILCAHFIGTWEDDPVVKRSLSRSQKIRKRDLGRCTAPGCSRRAVQAHHVEHRSHGGGDEDENQTGLCAYHHLVGIHGGFMTVAGKAPDQLAWTASGRPFRAGAQDPPASA